jgi:acyl CoA:acetate/3-ketoacid CoA transferase
MTAGRTVPVRSDLELEALVSTSRQGTLEADRLAIERRSIVDLCQETQSIAEVSARLGIPVNVTRILVDDLSEEGLVFVHQPAARGGKPSVDLLERVLHGLREL